MKSNVYPSHRSRSVFQTQTTNGRTCARRLAVAALGVLTLAISSGVAASNSAARYWVSTVLGLSEKPAVERIGNSQAAVSFALAPDGSSPSLNIERRGHTATLLADGRVLVVGGENGSGFIAAAEVFDPTTGTFSISGNLSTARADHSVTRLADGRALIAGGRSNSGALNSTEIFDPSSGAFTNGPNLNTPRSGQSATALGDGRIVFAGGDAGGSLEILDVSAATSTNAGTMSGARSRHSAGLLADGRVLLIGGRDADGNALASGEVCDQAGACSAIDSQLKVARVQPHLRVLFDGKVQIIGGSNDESLEIYDPQINEFGAYVHVHPEGDTCAGLPAQVQNSQTRAALFHNGQTDATYDRSRHTMSELSSQAIVIGGQNSNGNALNSAPLFNSSSAEISTDKLDYLPGETAHISGRGFGPGETVRIKVHEDPHTPIERGMDVIADPDGNFVGDYIVQEYDLRMKFLVGARGLTSGRTAQTAFTDANPDYQLEGQSATSPGSGVATGTWITGNLLNWRELDQVPMRLKITGNNTLSNQQVIVTFDHSNSNGSIPAIENIYNWGVSGGVSFAAGGSPTLTSSSGSVWKYTMTINKTTADGTVTFFGNLAAGAHSMPGSSLAIGTEGVSGGVLRITKPGASPGTPDLAVTKTGADTAAPGSSVTYTLGYSNSSGGALPASATGVQLKDTLPTGMTFSSCTGGCTVLSNEVTWNLGTLAIGASGSVTLTVNIGSGVANNTVLTNHAVINSAENDANSANNSVDKNTTVVTTGTTLAVSAATGTYGGTVNLSATLTQTSNSAAVSGKTIVFSLNGNPVCGGGGQPSCPATNGSGVASMSGVYLTSNGLSGGTPIIANSYPGGVAASFAGSSPYTGSTGSNSLTVNKATLSVNADNQAKDYGQSDPTATWSYSGFVSGEGPIPAGLTGSPICSYGGHSEDAGSYSGIITCTPNTLASTNYDFVTGTAGNLTINRITPTASITNSPVNYNGSPQTALVACLGGGAATLASGGTGTDAGSYPATVDCAQSTNYNAATGLAAGNFVINRITPTASITNSPVNYNGSPQTALVACLGGGAATLASGGTGTDAGSYPATVDCAQSTNYNAATGLAAGNFIINAVGSTVTVTCPPNVPYNGTAQTPCTASWTSTGADGETASLTVNHTNNTNAGTANAAATFAGDANHTGNSDTETFEILRVTLSVNAVHKSKTYGQSDPTPTWTYSGFVNSEGPTPAGLSGGADCSYASHSNDAGTYNSVITCNPGSLASTNYNFATGSLGNLTINAKDVTVTAQNKTRYYGEADPPFTFTVYGLVSPDTTLPGVTCGVPVPHANAGTYTNAITCSGNTNTNYNVTAYNPGTLTINPDPTAITLDNKTSGANFDCVNNKYTATLKDTLTNQGLGGVVLKLTIGTQNVTDTTDSNGLAEFTLTLNQPVGTKTESVEYVSGLTANYVNPTAVSRNFQVTPDVNVGPGTDSTSLYTGSNFFWTTSSTSSTATLTLSATIRDTSECAGLITTANVSFFVSTNGSTFNPVPNAQNLPVGLVDPNNRQVGTASAISQYNIGNDQSVTLTVRVVVGGQYSMTSSIYDTLITIGKSGAIGSLMGGGKLKNDGIPFFANGYFGLNSISAEFGSQVQYNKKGINPQGQVTVNVTSCNDRFGNLEPGCTKYTPEKWHHYYIKSNSISELSLISGSASFGSKTNVSEVLADGSKIGLDGGNTMQLIFTPLNSTAPAGSFVATTGVIDSTGKCTASGGCASIVIFRSTGGVWYSSSWGQAPAPATVPRTYVKKVVNGTVVVSN